LVFDLIHTYAGTQYISMSVFLQLEGTIPMYNI